MQRLGGDRARRSRHPSRLALSQRDLLPQRRPFDVDTTSPRSTLPEAASRTKGRVSARGCRVAAETTRFEWAEAEPVPAAPAASARTPCRGRALGAGLVEGDLAEPHGGVVVRALVAGGRCFHPHRPRVSGALPRARALNVRAAPRGDGPAVPGNGHARARTGSRHGRLAPDDPREHDHYQRPRARAISPTRSCTRLLCGTLDRLRAHARVGRHAVVRGGAELAPGFCGRSEHVRRARASGQHDAGPAA